MCQIIQKKTIDVGEVTENGLRLWSARFVYDQALNAHNVIETSLQRLKVRASNLLGWTMTSMSILIAVTIHNKYNFHILLILLVMLALLFLTALLCIKALDGVPWNFFNVSSTYMDELKKEYKNESEILKELVIKIDLLNERNTKSVNKTRKRLQWAQLIFLSVPTAGISLLAYILFRRLRIFSRIWRKIIRKRIVSSNPLQGSR
ncbi:hypothetical protein COMNV_00740 [Commensalibacter sp. Nvir]|uniref:hypothetical protein n=1 Tax=Commensalibacter sp. Nvir TaxID=3069817 RepID=UPI002D654A2D|nr:hypothetical protein COMNV_00740 [Commensalibacter sp. Nvir]